MLRHQTSSKLQSHHRQTRLFLALALGTGTWHWHQTAVPLGNPSDHRLSLPGTKPPDPNYVSQARLTSRLTARGVPTDNARPLTSPRFSPLTLPHLISSSSWLLYRAVPWFLHNENSCSYFFTPSSRLSTGLRLFSIGKSEDCAVLSRSPGARHVCLSHWPSFAPTFGQILLHFIPEPESSLGGKRERNNGFIRLPISAAMSA